MAGPTVEFRGFIPDDELPDLMARSKAFLFPGLEDFGITPVQANAAGRPVIAFAGGGALDTVVPGITGEHFAEQTVASLAAVLSRFDASRYDPDTMQHYTRQYDVGVFRHKFSGYVAQAWNSRRADAYN
jgi:glycosyltransferase involved in cell wall biosynthesis